MPETVTPNPYSPYATADPERRHIVPVPRLLADVGAAPLPGTLAGTGCGQLAVVPADVVLVEPGASFPPIACPQCVDAMRADRIDEPPREIDLCPECDRPTPYGLCVLCRQDRHNAWWAEQHAAGDVEHFKGCHPADAEAPEKPEGYEPQQTEECWHCGTSTPRGCGCLDCYENADYVPPASTYHCPTCGRWWAYLHLNITTITFNGDREG